MNKNNQLPMPQLAETDFQRVRSILDELVLDSKFFPARAKDDDWFHPRNADVVSGILNERKERTRAQSEDGQRGRSLSSSTLALARHPRCFSMDSIESLTSTTETSASSFSLSVIVDKEEEKEIFEEYYSPNVTSVHDEDVEPGAILGAGGFCEVRLAGLNIRRTAKAKDKRYDNVVSR